MDTFINKLSIKEKLGYGLGDTASNIVFQMVANFMLIFYTDVYGLSAAAAGTLLLSVRLFDGFTDPIMGGIADRTRTRWGSYRPYILFLALPYGLLACLAFITPDFNSTGKLIYAYVTYGLLMTCYTAINIPYGALGGVMASDPKERTSLQSYRFAMAMAALVVIVWAIPRLVEYFGQGEDAVGYPLAMIFMGSLAAVCFLLCFAMTKETLTNETDKHERSTQSIFKDFFQLFKNDQWLVIAIISLATLILIGIRASVAPHYIKYYIGDEDLLSNFLTLAAVGSVLGAISTNFLSKFIEKKILFQVALVVVIISHSLFYVIDSNQIALIFVTYFIANFAHMIITPIMFSMVADTVDYGVEKIGKRLTAITFSGHLLAIKFGFAIGGALAGWILSAYDYIPNQVQTDHTLSGILLAFAGIPIICTVVCLVVISKYRLTELEVKKIQLNLAEIK
ncbi:MFS transporter [Shewanella sp. 1_MG-2023]|uniref:glycoside-pentoside-hexuronide (GPH):cation symporter n=1 Tax=unclassified Shewanella TaxID=196818 RepID=UPI0026E2B7B6|nr:MULTISPECIES: MFS transporter [unclassified Shewanella]MDO6612860.1 MFS transporter [Shewanella sp. 7_MG-2023]MDO6772610.1 MFS transporter [Shewanella sp. 2_MG-2023]MDO6795186.1 MFS transporter [Shewanella sp. 1_MG-2023]